MGLDLENDKLITVPCITNRSDHEKNLIWLALSCPKIEVTLSHHSRHFVCGPRLVSCARWAPVHAGTPSFLHMQSCHSSIPEVNKELHAALGTSSRASTSTLPPNQPHWEAELTPDIVPVTSPWEVMGAMEGCVSIF